MDINKYDAVLCVTPDNTINEDDYNDRYTSTTATPYGVRGGGRSNWNTDDPKLWSNKAYGRLMQNELNGMGNGFSAEVTDLGKWVVVRITHHDYITGRSSSKTFLIVFAMEGESLVMNTANKWRTISGYSQAVSYIKSAASTLKSNTSSKI